MACGQALKYFQFLSTKKKSKIDPLQRVITWKSKIMSEKVKIGEFIGYGTSFLAEKKNESSPCNSILFSL
jgi:alanine racemase